MKLQVLALLALVTFTSANKKLVCYYGSWAVYRPGAGKFDVEQIDPFLCTHLIYGFTGLDGRTNAMIPLDPYNDLAENWGRGAFNRFNNLKKINPNLKTIIAIGGWNEGSVKYSKMASRPESRRQFVSSVVSFLQRFDFDGLDLDWEYPNNRGGKPEDKENFVQLLKEVREEFDKHGWLLTAAVSAGKATIDSAYNIPGVIKYLHFINVMTYDFHGSWEAFTGHNAPLNARPEESAEHHLLTVNASINYWLQNGASSDQLVLGMGLYGRSFTLANAANYNPGASSVGAGNGGPYTNEPGTLGYNEICEKISIWNVIRDPYYQAPYAHKQNQWVSYDDIDSLLVKCEFAKSLNLAGGMVWSIETDDFQGVCHGETFPLLKALRRCLNSLVSLPLPSTSNKPAVSTSSSTDLGTTPEITSIYCPSHGYHRNPDDCTRFYHCAKHNTGFKVTHFRCSNGLVYDTKTKVCQWPKFVPECNLE